MSKTHEEFHDNHNYNNLKYNFRSEMMVIVMVFEVRCWGTLMGIMGLNMLTTVSLAVVGFPLFLVFSPVLLVAGTLLVVAVAGFSLAAVFGVAGISILSRLFRSLRFPQDVAKEWERFKPPPSPPLGGGKEEAASASASAISDDDDEDDDAYYDNHLPHPSNTA